jgi:phosphoribosyl 1,2-cyclic phosphodiesterase
VSVRLGRNWVIFDAGTGIRNLGHAMLQEPIPQTHMSLFLSHVHWDHIQGFPFFSPAFRKSNRLRIHGLEQQDGTLGGILAGQMEGPSFPVSLEMMGARIEFSDLQEGAIVPIYDGAEDERIIGSVSNARLNHPNGVLAYRLEEAQTGRSLVYATDTEHYEDGLDQALVELARGADVLIYDGMYTPEEYLSHKGWGHSTWLEGFKVAKEAGVRQLVVFHHDPAHDDVFLAVYEREVRFQIAQFGSEMQLDFAREGMVIDLA